MGCSDCEVCHRVFVVITRSTNACCKKLRTEIMPIMVRCLRVSERQTEREKERESGGRERWRDRGRERGGWREREREEGREAGRER